MSPASLLAALRSRAAQGEYLRLAVAGAGFLGRGLVHQCARTPGLAVVALADRNPGRARAALASAPPEPGPAALVLDEVVALAEVDADAVIDCTGDPAAGARLGLAVLDRGRAFFTGAETDATIGLALARHARERGALYSSSGGDEHGEALRLVRHAELCGLEIVCAGKFKGFLDRAATPTSVMPWAERHRQSAPMLCSFADGTKMSFEMASLANASGLAPDVRGMHCPRIAADAVARTLRERPDGLLARAGAVDVVVGAQPSTAVFVVARADHPDLIGDLAYLHLGEGPEVLLTRPFHLCAVELAARIAEALLGGEPTIAPEGPARAVVFAAAKRDLAPGETLQRLGGTAHYGVIDAPERARGLLPAGLTEGARVRRAVRAGAPITLDDVEVDRDGPAWVLSGAG